MRILLKSNPIPAAPPMQMATAPARRQPVRRDVIEAERQVADAFSAATAALRLAIGDANTEVPSAADQWDAVEALENKLRTALQDGSLDAEERARIERCIAFCRLLPGLIRIPSLVRLPVRMLVHVNSGAYLTALLLEAARAVLIAGEAVDAALRSPSGGTIVPAMRRHSEAWTAIRAAAIRSGVGCPPIPARVFRAGLIALGVAADTYSAMLAESDESLASARRSAA